MRTPNRPRRDPAYRMGQVIGAVICIAAAAVVVAVLVAVAVTIVRAVA